MQARARRTAAALCAAAALAVGTLACGSPPPVESSSGERIEALEIEERFALSEDTRASSLRGERLRKAIALLERHGLFALEGTFEDRSVIDAASLTVVLRPAAAAERRIVVRNCNEPRVCAFFRDAVAENVVGRSPAVCRAKSSCDGHAPAGPEPVSGDTPEE